MLTSERLAEIDELPFIGWADLSGLDPCRAQAVRAAGDLRAEVMRLRAVVAKHNRPTKYLCNDCGALVKGFVSPGERHGEEKE